MADRSPNSFHSLPARRDSAQVGTRDDARLDRGRARRQGRRPAAVRVPALVRTDRLSDLPVRHPVLADRQGLRPAHAPRLRRARDHHLHRHRHCPSGPGRGRRPGRQRQGRGRRGPRRVPAPPPPPPRRASTDAANAPRRRGRSRRQRPHRRGRDRHRQDPRRRHGQCRRRSPPTPPRPSSSA